jgi:putative ABC transport system permease protein
MTSRYHDIPIGTTIIIQFGRHERRLKVVGVVRDSFADPPQFGADPVFFSTPETAVWLTGDGYDRLDVRMVAYDEAEAEILIDAIRDRLEDMGANVWGWWLRDPSEHWFQESVDTVFLILVVLGVLALGLSVFLIINTMNAIISQQVWQIGVMKAVGATEPRVVRVYLTVALIYGGLALVLAVPLGAVGAHLMASWVLELVNISLRTLRLNPAAVAIQVVVALIVPLAAAYIPVIGGARVTTHKAISSYGLGGDFGRGWLDRLVGRVRRLPRPLALSLRNTFRRKARVALTLATLALSGAMFMMVMSVHASFNRTVDVMLNDFGGDVMVWFAKSYRVTRLTEVTEDVAGVVKAEVWTRRWVPLTGDQERYIVLVGVPPNSEILNPRIVGGRMLLPKDGHAIVMNQRIAADEGISVGDEITVKFDEQEITWTVVGLFLNPDNGQTNNLVPFDVLAGITGRAKRGSWVTVMSDKHDPESHQQLVRRLRETYAARGLEATYFETAGEMRDENWEQFRIVLYLLLMMAVLAAVVGGIGMMSTMSINVVERRREIGVMRATGAGSVAIVAIFVAEGVFVGLLSWLFAVPISVPSARLFSDVVGETLLYLPFDFTYPVSGVALWLLIVVGLSALASLWPALHATRVSVWESLAYE